MAHRNILYCTATPQLSASGNNAPQVSFVCILMAPDGTLIEFGTNGFEASQAVPLGYEDSLKDLTDQLPALLQTGWGLDPSIEFDVVVAPNF